MRTTEGSVVVVEESFFDDLDQPLYPQSDDMGPVVSLIDPEDRSVIAQVVATPGEIPGTWTADLAVPNMGLTDDKRLSVTWRYESEEGLVQAREELIVEPLTENRVTDIVCLFGDEETFELTLPFHFDVRGDKLRFQLALNNQMIADNIESSDAGVKMIANRAKTCVFKVPVWVATRRLEPISLIAMHTSNTRKTTKMYTYKLWVVTPQVLIAASLVEDHINKARAYNVIPELEYSQGDIIGYLYRGLALFNMIGPRVTGWAGTNMQGTILDGWITCACYYALAAQLQAEGQMAFDFTGQVVNLNMDRTPSIEAALGRLETQIQGPVTNLKNKLSKAGLNEGDGSQGAKAIDGARSLGKLGVTNSPTTKWSTMGNRNIWVNARYRVT
ncbi:head-tail connector protein [Erwinia phage vB_EamM_Y3]|uniref:Putative head to tail joining protein n=1 Tax=Erwinia phage vB_EamM_Y3 TaxID=1983553 RepID=A0A2H4IB89_9CAUD|nr:head-tail connector protein [Erwinia phage vB_EamM_Y3]ARW58822.1 putative head to tail joining protein [Erwinia phage vB_EamM_Y3]QZE56045.1 hypothetical protein pEaSNUABM52_00187 [Erwinia phage pEp_SNUABM_52]